MSTIYDLIEAYNEGYEDGRRDAEIKDAYSEGFEIGKQFGTQIERQRCRKSIEDIPEIENLSEGSYDFLKSNINNRDVVISFFQGFEIGVKKKILERM